MEGKPDTPYAAEFPARHSALLRVQTFVEDACARAKIVPADHLRLMLLIEELFVNTVSHGHGRDSDEPVRLALTVTSASIAVEYGDTAQPYDPFAPLEIAPDREDIADRPVGGLGVRLITTMAEDVGYVRDDGWNRILFRLPRSR